MTRRWLTPLLLSALGLCGLPALCAGQPAEAAAPSDLPPAAPITSPSALPDAEPIYRPGERLLFADEFDVLNNEVWEHELTLGGGGNWEFQYYTNNRSNSFVRDGVLYLKPTLTSEFLGIPEGDLMNGHTIDLWGSTPADTCTGNAFYGCTRTSGAGGNVINPIQSARLRTAHSFSFKYGRVEIRAKLPRGDWIWPALWMMPRYNQYGAWPASGEIDIMESRGNRPGYAPGGRDTMGSTLHWGPDWSRNRWDLTHAEYKGKDLSQDFHVYGLKWDERGMFTYVDDESNKVMSLSFQGQDFWARGGFDKEHGLNNPWSDATNAAPFDQKFYLIMNVAVGGTNSYWSDGYGKPWNNQDQHAVNAFWNARNQWYPTWDGDDAAMQIDWVRIYE